MDRSTLASGRPMRAASPSSSRTSPGRDPEPVALTAEERGYFSGFLPAAGPGTRYRLRLDDEQTLVADPASRLQPEGVYGPSMVVDPAAFAWEVDAWQVPPFPRLGALRAARRHLHPGGDLRRRHPAPAISQGPRRDRHRAHADRAVPRRAELGLRRRLPLRRAELLRRPRRAAASGRRRAPRRASGRPRRRLQPPRPRGQLSSTGSARTSPTATARPGATRSTSTARTATRCAPSSSTAR